MSCEDQSPLADSASSLFLRSNCPPKPLSNVTRDTTSAIEGFVKNLITDEDGNLLPASSSVEDVRQASFTFADQYCEESLIFQDIVSFATNLDLTNANERFGSGNIADLTNALNNFLDNADLSPYPQLNDRVTGGPLSASEVGDFLISSDTDFQNLLDQLNGSVLDNNFTINSALTDLNNYYNTNIGRSLSRGVCSDIASLILTILAALDALNFFVKQVKRARDIIQDILDTDFKKLAIQLIQQLTIENLKKLILDIIKKVFEKAIDKLTQVTTAVVGIISGITGTRQKVSSTLDEICRDLEEFFSDEGCDRLVKKIEKFINSLAVEFERFTLESVAQLIYRLCVFIEGIEFLILFPVNQFQELANSLKAEDSVLRSIGLINTKKAVEAGANRISKEDRDKITEEARLAMNEASPSLNEIIDGAGADYQTAKEITAEESQELFCLKESGVPNRFTFSEDAVEPYKEGSPTKRYRLVKNIVYARLIRVSKRTEYTFNVIKAFEAKSTEENRGGAKNSMMQSGSAIHIKIEGDSRWVSRVIVSAIQEGFKGIGIHNDYIHLDIGPRELKWIAGRTSGFEKASSPVISDGDTITYNDLFERVPEFTSNKN